MITDFGEIIQAKTNANGTKVVFTVAAANLIPDGKLYVWDIEGDIVSLYDFHKYDFLENEPLDDIDLSKEVVKRETDTALKYDEKCRNRIPTGFCWDNNDSRLLICSARKVKLPVQKKGFLARSKSGQ